MRKTGTIKLEVGVNQVELPSAGQIVGFDAQGDLRAIYEAPSDYLGIDRITLEVVRVGEVFDSLGRPFVLLGTATPPGVRPVLIYQLWE